MPRVQLHDQLHNRTLGPDLDILEGPFYGTIVIDMNDFSCQPRGVKFIDLLDNVVGETGSGRYGGNASLDGFCRWDSSKSILAV